MQGQLLIWARAKARPVPMWASANVGQCQCKPGPVQGHCRCKASANARPVPRTVDGSLEPDCGWLSRAGLWMALSSRTLDGSLEPDCGWLSRAGLWMALSSRTVDGQCQERFGPGPRTWASAKNVGQCQEREPVPTIVGARMIGAFRPLQIVSSYSHCHKVQRCLKVNDLTWPITHVILSR
jgi:hypothetical protein